MNRSLRLLFLLALLALLAGWEASSSFAAPSGGIYSIYAWSVSGGGGSAQAGDYSLTATLGQPAANQSASSGDYTSGGFWPSRSPAIYLPMITR